MPVLGRHGQVWLWSTLAWHSGSLPAFAVDRSQRRTVAVYRLRRQRDCASDPHRHSCTTYHSKACYHVPLALACPGEEQHPTDLPKP